MHKKPVKTFVINHSNSYPVEELLKCYFEHVIDQKRAPVISVNMYNFNFPALIDTGSECTCLSGDVYNQLSGHYDKIPVFPVSGVRITGAFKTKERRVTHQLLLSFSVESGKVFAHEFLLITDLIFPVILGIDFLRSVKAQNLIWVKVGCFFMDRGE